MLKTVILNGWKEKAEENFGKNKEDRHEFQSGEHRCERQPQRGTGFIQHRDGNRKR